MKLRLICVGIVLLALAAAFVWWKYSGGVSHRTICERVGDESAAIRTKVDVRADRLEARLDRIEAKLDRLLKLAERPPLPDNMLPAGE